MRLLIAILIAASCFAQVTGGDRFKSNAVEFAGVAPSSNTSITTRTVYVGGVVLYNNHASAARTVNIRTRGTECSAGPCRITVTDLTIAAKSMYVVSLPYIKATSGIQLSCTEDATSVEYRIVGSY